jgi:multisubunit Na+/H+ antiporter MnhB subunit
MRSILAGVLAAGLSVALVVVLNDLPREGGDLGEEVAARAGETGATHPVTAVLLGFRAFDTWLEVAVILAAALGVLAVSRTHDVRDRPPPGVEPLLSWMTAIVVPTAALVGAFLLWLGTSGPGGAFQAGSVAGAALLLVWLSGRRGVAALTPRALASLLSAGTAAFLAMAVIPMAAGAALLEVPPDAATTIIIAVESGVTVAVAVALPVVVLGSRPGGGAP